MSYTNIVIIILVLFFTGCDAETKSDPDSFLIDYKAKNISVNHFDNYSMSHEYNSALYPKSDLNKFNQIVKGNKTILEFYHSSESKSLEDSWGKTRLIMVFNDFTPDLIGETIVFPSQNTSCSGVQEYSEMRYFFPEVKGSIKVLEISDKSVLIEIQDSLYSTIKVYEDTMEENSIGEDSLVKNGFEYDMHYKVNYNKIRFIKE